MGRRVSLKASVPSLRQILARFWPQIRKQRFLIAGSSVALFSEVLFRLLEPWPLLFIIDHVIVTTPAGGSSKIGWLDSLSRPHLGCDCCENPRNRRGTVVG